MTKLIDGHQRAERKDSTSEGEGQKRRNRRTLEYLTAMYVRVHSLFDTMVLNCELPDPGEAEND